MKRYLIGGVLVCSLLCNLSSQAQSLYYDFKDTFSERNGNGPALNQLGTGSFISDSLSELSCLPRRLYTFGNNDGVQFDNAAAGTFIGETYSIEMYFKWLNNAGFKRIIDFKNRTEDFGLYATPSLLSFYDGLDVNTTSFVAGQYVYLCVTRDSATQLITMYVDGNPIGSFNDVNERGTLDTSQVLNFFRDDLIFGGEARPGNIAFLKLHNFELNAAQVAASFASISDTMHLLTFAQNTTTSCLNGNQIDFTNTSENDSSVISYLWDFGDGASSPSFSASHSYAASGPFVVSLIATAPGGCTDTAFGSVEIFPQPVVDLGPDVSACQGTSVMLDAGTFASYLWSDGSVTQTLSVTASGVYTVTVTDANGCSSPDSVAVNFTALPVFDLGNDSTICAGQSLQLSAPAGMAAYLWSTGETTQDILVSVSGIYAGVVTDLNGCSSADTITITVNPLPVVTLGADTAICDGTTLTLDAGTGYAAYLWNDNSAGQTLSVATTGTYTVTVTDFFGCQGTDSTAVLILALPVVDLGPDTSICGGTLVTLDAGTGQTAYLWSDGSQNQTLNVAAGGTYAVTVTDANGCSAADQVTLTVNPLINLGPDLIVCDGQPVLLDAGAGLAGYAWSTGETTQTIQASATGNYSVQITDGNGCFNSDTLAITFSIAPVVDLGPDLSVCQFTTVSLDAGPGFASYLWSDGSSLQTFDVTASGTYAVTVTNGDGCAASDSVTISYNAAPVVTLYGDTTLCFGNTLLLDAGAGFSAYLWNDGSVNQTYAVNFAGTYTVTVTDANGCTGSDAINVSINPPVTTPLISQINSNTIQSSSPTGNQWYQVPGGLISGATGQTYSPPQNGTFYVVVTDALGCVSAPSPDFAFVNTGLVDAANSIVQVYPNPATDRIQIRTAGWSTRTIRVTILDLTGKSLQTWELPANTTTTLDLSDLASGTYGLRLETPTGREIRMISLQK